MSRQSNSAAGHPAKHRDSFLLPVSVRGEAGHNMAPLPPSPELPDFSLTLGGPLYRVLERSHLAKRVATLLGGQTAAVVFLCWVPLAALSLAQPHLPGGVTPTFLRDVETHVRFLVSLPVLIMGDYVLLQKSPHNGPDSLIDQKLPHDQHRKRN